MVKHRKIKFSDKKNPRMAIVSFLFALFSLFLMGAIIIYSATLHGSGPLFLGGLGLGAVFLTLIGFIMAIRSFKKEGIYYRYPIISAILNGVLLLSFLAIYVVGFSLF